MLIYISNTKVPVVSGFFHSILSLYIDPATIVLTTTMPAYVVTTVKVHDPDTYRKYAALTPATLKKYGAKFLTRGGEVTTLEGELFSDRLLILEFPDKEAVHAWYKDPDYVAAMELRHAASTARILIQEGVPDGVVPDPKV